MCLKTYGLWEMRYGVLYLKAYIFKLESREAFGNKFRWYIYVNPGIKVYPPNNAIEYGNEWLRAFWFNLFEIEPEMEV